MDTTSLLNSILSSDLQASLLPLKIVFIILSVIFFAGIILLASRTSFLRIKYFQDWDDMRHFKKFKAGKFIRKWKRIKKRLDKNKEKEAKNDILEADKLMDEILKRMGYSGENFDERLDKIKPDLIPSLGLLKQNHMVAKKLEQDFEYYISLKDAKKIIDNYEQVLKDLQIL